MQSNLVKFKDHYMKSYSNFKSKLDILQGSKSQFTFGNNENDESLKQNVLRDGDESSARLTNVEEAMNKFQSYLSDLHRRLQIDGAYTVFDKLNSRVKEIVSRMSGDSVSIDNGGLIFTSEIEVGTWLESEEVHTIGIFWDIFSVLVAIRIFNCTVRYILN